MSKRIWDVVKTGNGVQKLTSAISHGIDARSIEDALRDLGLDVEVDTVDWGNHGDQLGIITIEGGENETGVILTLKLVKAEVGWDTLHIGDPEPTVSEEDHG